LLYSALKERSTTMLARNTYRAAVGVALAAAFILVWLNLAVSRIGLAVSECCAGANSCGRRAGGLTRAPFRRLHRSRLYSRVGVLQAMPQSSILGCRELVVRLALQ
jgi:hypothetical protein